LILQVVAYCGVERRTASEIAGGPLFSRLGDFVLVPGPRMYAIKAGMGRINTAGAFNIPKSHLPKVHTFADCKQAAAGISNASYETNLPRLSS